MNTMQNFVQAYEALQADYYERMGYTQGRDTVRFTTGPKHYKLIVGSAVMAFVDKLTGDIYKPASWRGPAKHVRGNINSNRQGMEAFGQIAYINYLR